MVHNNKEVLEYWNKPDVESMYDKNLINAEIKLINSKITEGSKILDAGCGEGEGTVVYASNKGASVYACDFSETRLEKARERVGHLNNITLKQVDFLKDYSLDTDFDFIVSQRFIINLMEWDLQKKVILELINHLKPGGTFLMLEGYEEGVNELNDLRAHFGLGPIPVKWHNLFLQKNKIDKLIQDNNLQLTGFEGLGTYFMLTRGIRPCFDNQLNWDTEFNKIAASATVSETIGLNTKFSRLALWSIKRSK
ncbi:MAG: class I SAM-dependent methyltransferase [Bacteroidales bacterium]|nr:class I SAM-dependent methyltransferase [Bacteroidales bacterium]